MFLNEGDNLLDSAHDGQALHLSAFLADFNVTVENVAHIPPIWPDRGNCSNDWENRTGLRHPVTLKKCRPGGYPRTCWPATCAMTLYVCGGDLQTEARERWVHLRP